MALRFDGTGDSARNNNGVAGIDSAQFTMACRMRVASLPSLSGFETAYMTASDISGGNSAGAIQSYNDSGTLRVQVEYRFSSAIGRWHTVDAFELGQCLCVAMVYDRSSTANVPTVYVNGIKPRALITDASPAGTAKTGVDSITCGLNVGGSGDFAGDLQDIAFWSRMLPAEQIAPYMTGGKPRSNPRSLQASWPTNGNGLWEEIQNARLVLSGAAVIPDFMVKPRPEVQPPVLMRDVAPPVGAIMNQFQRNNLGADLYNGMLQ